MYARSTTLTCAADRIDAGIALVRDEVMPQVLGLAGCAGLSMIVDRPGGLGIVTTSWQSLDAMRATEERVAPMRARAAEVTGGTLEVQEWEIATMHREHRTGEASCARATWLRIEPQRLDDLVNAFRWTALPKIEELDGFCSASLMVDRESGRCVGTIAFDDRAALEASREQATAIRTGVAGSLGAEILEVREFELVLAHLRVPELV